MRTFIPVQCLVTNGNLNTARTRATTIEQVRVEPVGGTFTNQQHAKQELYRSLIQGKQTRVYHAICFLCSRNVLDEMNSRKIKLGKKSQK